MSSFTKSERKLLRKFADVVYEAEARSELSELDSAFKRWRAKELPSSILIEEIHVFHQGGNRRLWSLYSGYREEQIVARGLALGFISQKAIPPTLLAKLSPIVDSFRE